MRRTLGPLTALAILAAAGGAEAAITTEQWAPVDVPFSAASAPAAPFAVPFSATVTGPAGSYDIPGFYDGNGTFKVRISASAPGMFTVTTHSATVPALDGQVATVTVSSSGNTRVHGALRVDPARPEQLVYEDGIHPFLSAYECDWLWALGLADGTIAAADQFLDKLSSYGFNQIVMNAFSIDTSWKSGTTSAADYGPPPQGAWGGTIAAPDYTTFNLTYWQHYDAIMEALRTRGISAHIFFRVYNKNVVWPKNASPSDDAYFQWIVARYAAYPNIVWDFSKEAQHEADTTYKKGRLALIRKLDPYHRLTTVHDDQSVYDSGAYAGLVDIRTDQTHSNFHATVLTERTADKMPIMNSEYGYEWGPGGANDLTYPVGQSPETMLDWSWQIATAGGFGAYYYTYTAWDVLRPSDTPPGYAYYKNLTAFFETVNFWDLLPSDQLVAAEAGGKGPLYALAKPGEEYVVYAPSGGAFVLTVAGATAPLNVQWFSPKTGVWGAGAPVSNGVQHLAPPSALSGPLAVHIGTPAAPPSTPDAGAPGDSGASADAATDAPAATHDAGSHSDAARPVDSSVPQDSGTGSGPVTDASTPADGPEVVPPLGSTCALESGPAQSGPMGGWIAALVLGIGARVRRRRAR